MDLDASIQNWQEKPSDLVLLSYKDEIALPKIRELRTLTEVPIVLISQPIQEDFHVELLESGIDQICRQRHRQGGQVAGAAVG